MYLDVGLSNETLSLRQMLTMPYVALVVVLAIAIGGLSYSAGREAVDALSDRLLSEMIFRISQAVEHHVFGAGAVLETAFPTGALAPMSEDDFVARYAGNEFVALLNTIMDRGDRTCTGKAKKLLREPRTILGQEGSDTPTKAASAPNSSGSRLTLAHDRRSAA